MKHFFNPTEIIFAATDACNLHCEHCFVKKGTHKLDIEQAKKFILSCKNTSIEKIGFSGGEPFLYPEFLLEITKFTIEQDFMFDQIMTNGDWWHTESELKQTLQNLYDAGYDGKFGLSWDTFHAQNEGRMLTFIRQIQEFFGENSINIQTVKSDKGGESLPLALRVFVENSVVSASERTTPSSGAAVFSYKPRNALYETTVYVLPQTYQGSDTKAWNAKRWFKEDYCEGPGNIFYIHPNGKIAPCCGFANENEALFIGDISNTYEEVLENSKKNEMIKICFEKGLSRYRRNVKKQIKRNGKKLQGKCGDICSFCDFVCQIKKG